jgi:hypothetical protein
MASGHLTGALLAVYTEILCSRADFPEEGMYFP